MIIQYLHHGNLVSVQDQNKGKHREACLCFSGCKKFKPDNRAENCPIANKLYAFDIEYSVTTPVWECAQFKAE